MAIQNITFGDKSDLTTTSVADANKIKASDMNEIKSVVNNNATEMGDLYPVTLYSNASGDNGNITLSETAGNFTFLDIFYKSNDDVYQSVRVYEPNNKKVSLQMLRPTATSVSPFYMKSREISISNTSITSGFYVEVYMNTNGEFTILANNYIYITKVIGYK